MRFQVLTAINIKMAVFWNFMLCSLVQINPRFRGGYCPHHEGHCDHPDEIGKQNF